MGRTTSVMACAPKSTPAEIVDKLNREINTALGDPKIKARFAGLGAADRGLARGLWKDHCRRYRKMGQGHQVLGRQAELIGSATASSVVENPA
jgi:hypothetical protein